MPLEKLALIIVCVVAGATFTVWAGLVASAAWQMPAILPAAMIPAGLILFIGWRVIAERLGNAEDDHYDKIER